MEKIADEDDKRRIDIVLADYPSLQSIITKNPDFYRMTRAQFGETTPPHQQECRLSGILNEIYPSLELIEYLEQLESLLNLYPEEYRTKVFGKKICDDFFSFFSEIEVYHYLRKRHLVPVREPIISINGREKKLDFSIKINETNYYIELVTPRPSQQWEGEFDRGGTGFGDPRKGLGPKNIGYRSRLNDIILKEIKKHFLDVPEEKIAYPILIIVNVRLTAREIIIGDELLIFDEISRNIYGIVLYDGIQSKYFPNPHLKIDECLYQIFS